MSRFPRFLSEFRQQRGLTQKALGEAIDHSGPFVAALEMVKDGRKPSFGTLRKLVIALAKEPTGGINRRMALSLILSALELDEDIPIPSVVGVDRAYYQALARASEVWVISDALPEPASWVAKVMAERSRMSEKIRYYFLIPFSTPRWQWRAALDDLRECGISDDIVVFGVSNCAFPVRVHIVDPRGQRARGFYLIGPPDPMHQEMCQMPAELLIQTIRAYTCLCTMHKKNSWEIEGEPELGFIQLLHPEKSFTDEQISTTSTIEREFRMGSVAPAMEGAPV